MRQINSGAAAATRIGGMTASPTPRTAAAPSSAHSAAHSPAPLSGTALAELTAALAVRELQLRTRLVRNGHAVPEADITHDVADLKDRAAEGAQQAVDDAEADVLRGQHARVGAAPRRAARMSIATACAWPAARRSASSGCAPCPKPSCACPASAHKKACAAHRLHVEACALKPAR